MVCYARPVSMMTAIVLVVFVAFGKPTVHFFDTAALIVAVTVALAAAAVAAALVFAASVPARRRRAAAGGCVTCQFRCQHAMTGQSARPWPVSAPSRARAASGIHAPGRPAAAGRPAEWPGRPAAAGGAARRTLLPIQPVAPRPVRDKKDLELIPAPRWPDRPVYRLAEPARQRAT